MEKIWLKHYPKHVPHTIDLGEYDSLADLFEQSCTRYADKIAYENLGVALNYHDLYSKSRDLAAFFQEKLKLKPGDCVALMLPNILQFPVALFAALRAGLVVTNINPLYKPREVKVQLQDSQAKAIIVMENFAHTVAKIIDETQVTEVIVTGYADLFPTLKRLVINFALKYLKGMVPCYRFKTSDRFCDALNRGAALTFTPVPLTHEDSAFLQYTGGTTGQPKGAVLTHGNVLANIIQCVSWVHNLVRDGEDRIIVALPLYHIFSLTICCMSFLKVGAMGVLVTNPRDLDAFVKTLKRVSCTVFVGLNTLFSALLAHKRFKQVDFTSLRLTISGGMALSPDVAEMWQQLTQTPILEGYGLTEASPVVTINPTTSRTFTGSIGLPIPSTDVSIRDEENNEVRINEVGELWVKGPQIMKGYWRQPEATKKVIVDGWLCTGDMVRMDEAGMIYVVDRKKDMILVSGFNVYPHEIEDVMASHPQVAEVGVIGVPDEKTGEAVKAYVVVKGDVSKEALLRYCREQLTGYKMPKHIEFRANLPRSTVGKILRRELREDHDKQNGT